MGRDYWDWYPDPSWGGCCGAAGGGSDYSQSWLLWVLHECMAGRCGSCKLGAVAGVCYFPERKKLVLAAGDGSGCCTDMLLMWLQIAGPSCIQALPAYLSLPGLCMAAELSTGNSGTCLVQVAAAAGVKVVWWSSRGCWTIRMVELWEVLQGCWDDGR